MTDEGNEGSNNNQRCQDFERRIVGTRAAQEAVSVCVVLNRENDAVALHEINAPP